jgi:hypothetical protein
MVYERDCRLATRGSLDPSQADSVAHCSRRKATGGNKAGLQMSVTRIGECCYVRSSIIGKPYRGRSESNASGSTVWPGTRRNL